MKKKAATFDIAHQLKLLADWMELVSKEMRRKGGQDVRMKKHAGELAGAADIARAWSNEIKEVEK